MKILVVSDNHYDKEVLDRLLLINNDCDLYLHLGDSELPNDLIYPFISVKGNCDRFFYPPYKVIETSLGKIFMEHIPFNYFKEDELKKDNYIIYLHGHTHRKRNEKINNVLVLNPGSLNYPRDGSKSYLIIEIDKEIKVNFYKF